MLRNARWCVVVLATLMVNALVVQADLIEIDGLFEDWDEIRVYEDLVGDTFGGPDDGTMDIVRWAVCNDDAFLYVMVQVNQDISDGQTDRGAYQLVTDSDADYATGIQTDTESPYPPHDTPLGVDRYVSVETEQGVFVGVDFESFAPNATDIGQNIEVAGGIRDAFVVGDRYELRADLEGLGIELDQPSVHLIILHYSGAGTVDWTIPTLDYHLGDFIFPVAPLGRLPVAWAEIRASF